MGVYLYGIRKAARKQITVNGVTHDVRHKLEFKMKPWYSFWRSESSEKKENAIINRLCDKYGNRFVGPVMYGDLLVMYNGAPFWYDGANGPFTVIARIDGELVTPTDPNGRVTDPAAMERIRIAQGRTVEQGARL